MDVLQSDYEFMKSKARKKSFKMQRGKYNETVDIANPAVSKMNMILYTSVPGRSVQ